MPAVSIQVLEQQNLPVLPPSPSCGRIAGGIRAMGSASGRPLPFVPLMRSIRMRYMATANSSLVRLPVLWISARSQIWASASSGSLEPEKKGTASSPGCVELVRGASQGDGVATGDEPLVSDIDIRKVRIKLGL